MDKYHLNLLSVPREKAEVGDLYVYDGKRASAPGKISSFLNETIEMPEVQKDQIKLRRDQQPAGRCWVPYPSGGGSKMTRSSPLSRPRCQRRG